MTAGSPTHVSVRRCDDGRRFIRDARRLAVGVNHLRHLSECEAAREAFGGDREGR
jgi:hypothetical protein